MYILCLVLGKYYGETKDTNKENIFLIFGFAMENPKENQIYLNLVTNLCILRLFTLYMEKKIMKNLKYRAYKNNFLTLNLFFIFLHFFFPSIYSLYFLSPTFSLKFSRNQTYL